ncbi:MAG: type II toxin-antitoxin system RelE/ParE family toxin [Okeania sp. SIO2H7]|nr:type II toxin-antitoxin system RelE/ParE family toxin [Okeania sp. SIO2H7]
MAFDFHPKAQQELEEAVSYYDNINPILGNQLIAEIELVLSRIEQFPESWPKLSANTRRCRTKNFPYGVVYKRSETGIFIVAVMHLQRKPNYWSDRL